MSLKFYHIYLIYYYSLSRCTGNNIVLIRISKLFYQSLRIGKVLINILNKSVQRVSIATEKENLIVNY